MPAGIVLALLVPGRAGHSPDWLSRAGNEVQGAFLPPRAHHGSSASSAGLLCPLGFLPAQGADSQKCPFCHLSQELCSLHLCLELREEHVPGVWVMSIPQDPGHGAVCTQR